MKIKTSFQDVKTSNGTTMRVFIYEPNLPEYPEAKWPGVVCFSEIYQVTGPVERFASNIASAGYVVAAPSSFHEFEGPEAIPYDVEGTDRGNKYKADKKLEAYDEDCTLSIDLLVGLKSCTGRVAATGMCLGGHLALRAAFDPRCLSTFCYFATDIHSASLGLYTPPADPSADINTLPLISQGKLAHCEVAMVFGKQDTHVDREGRSMIRDGLDAGGGAVSFYEVQAEHAFIRDTSSKGRWDAALSRSLFGLMMELFERTVGRDLGPRKGGKAVLEHIC
ncbi:putative carboxymethylenebutenolidase [Mrakia frigida]|uniref:carboxymethylenebutenolidase n=1 Tax=Mrakia frigida TaxID=29902 RepID=UPI003FCC22C9